MTMQTQAEIIADQSKKAQPLFQTRQEYQDFRASFFEQVRVELDRHREARRLSEEESKRHSVA